MLWVFSLILKIATGLVIIAFITLLERNLLRLTQSRVGPKKVGPLGLFQPFSDALKLLIKSTITPVVSNYVFLLIPSGFFLLSVIGLTIIPVMSSVYYFYYGAFVMLLVSALRVYPILFSGWFSNSKWGLIGSLRGIAQSISYEVRIAFILISLIVYQSVIALNNIKYISLIMGAGRGIIWLISVLAELNRTPFDLAEGESELVSGYNTEYSGSLFTLLFISEYNFILVISGFTSFLFFGIGPPSIVIILFILWARSTLPRIRVDFLINLTWHTLLPIRIMFLLINRVFARGGGILSSLKDIDGPIIPVQYKVDRLMCMI